MKFFVASLLLCALFIASLFVGAVEIPPLQVWNCLCGDNSDQTIRFIILGNRLPQAITAVLAGSSLAVAGLLMQTLFRNPLAGPSILGISSGANLGVAVVMLFLGSSLSIGSLAVAGYLAIIIGAFAGSLLVMAVLILLSSLLRNDLMFIITGVLIGYLTSSIITLLTYQASAQGVQGFVMWGMAAFNAVNVSQIPVFAVLVGLGLLISFLLVKPLNVLLLGDEYARNLGVNIRRVRNLILLSSGLLTAVSTAFCGPVSFLGLAVPHIARLIWPTDNHRVLMPAVALSGAAVGLLCCLLSVIPSEGVAPLNAVTPLIGVPVILYVLIRRR